MLIILSVLQFTIVPLIAIGSVIPNLIILLIVFFALKYSQLYGTIFGAISGLVFDLISGGILGSAMFSFTLGGFIAGYFYNENKIDYNISTMFFVLVVFLSSMISSLFFLLMTSSEIKLTASHIFLEQGILPGIYSAILAIPLVIYNQRKQMI